MSSLGEYEDDAQPTPVHGNHGTCAVCGGEIEFYDSPHGSWWSHVEHPADGHDAQLGGPA